MTITAIAGIEYYRQLQKAHKEYEKARDYVEDIVLSFNRELKRESDRLELISVKMEGTTAKTDSSQKEIESIHKRITPFEQQLGAMNQAVSQVVSQHTQNTALLSELSGLDSKIRDLETTQENLRVKMTTVEDQLKKISETSVTEVRNEPVIVIKRDKAMATLTDTEIVVLEMLAKEGSKTAPEIKERVKLSREHTARLMKKLYEEGYLEREAGKIPFRYNIKKEMESLMQKTEGQAL